jgi:hypothetical protein
MNSERLKLIVRNLELLVDSLKVEIYTDNNPTNISPQEKNVLSGLDYDEIFVEDYGL